MKIKRNKFSTNIKFEVDIIYMKHENILNQVISEVVMPLNTIIQIPLSRLILYSETHKFTCPPFRFEIPKHPEKRGSHFSSIN